MQQQQQWRPGNGGRSTSAAVADHCRCAAGRGHDMPPATAAAGFSRVLWLTSALLPCPDHAVHADCVCPDVYAPVCGTNGVTYPSRCDASCRGNTAVAHEGRCGGGANGTAPGAAAAAGGGRLEPSACAALCPAADKPVCGVDGNSYVNPCALKCHGTHVAYPGTCKDGAPAAASCTACA